MNATLVSTLRYWAKSRNPQSPGAKLGVAAADEIDRLNAEVEKLQRQRDQWKPPAKGAGDTLSAQPSKEDRLLAAGIKHLREQKARDDATRDERIARGVCPECDGEGQQGGQFCGGYWTCETCNGSGAAQGTEVCHYPDCKCPTESPCLQGLPMGTKGGA